MAMLDRLRRWFGGKPAGSARTPVPRTRAQEAEDEVRDLVFGDAPPESTTAEPARVDPSQPTREARRPYLEITEAELEAHTREEEEIASGSTAPSPRGLVGQVIGTVTAPWRAMPENLRLLLVAVGVLFVVLGGMVPYLVDAINVAFTPVTGR